MSLGTRLIQSHGTASTDCRSARLLNIRICCEVHASPKPSC